MSEMLTAVAILFIAAGPFLLIANRYDLTAAPLLILAGIVVGEFIDEGLALELAQFGIALLVFSFGIGIQLSAIESVLEDSELAALGQIFVVGSLGVGFGVLVGLPPGEAIYVGVAVALSSTMVGTALLETEIRRDLVQGRLGDSIQFVQDLFAIGFLLVAGAGVLAADPIAMQVGYGAFFLVAAALVNRHVFHHLTRLAGGSDELMIVGVISLLVVFIGAAELADVSIVVGAFAAGLAVRHEPGQYLGLYNGLESVKDFFVAIFFVTVGALVVLPVPFLPFVDIGWDESVTKLLLAGGIVLLTVIIKPAVTIALLVYRGYEARTATLVGLSTDQVSEFALIITIQALLLELLTQSVFDAIILAAAVSMATSTLTQRYNEEIYRALRDRGLISGRHGKIDERSDVPEELTDHVVILGYGRKGRRLVDTCESIGRPYVVVENDPARWDEVRANCNAYVFGDALESYTWEKTNADEATVIVSTTASKPVSRRLLDLEFDATVILRAETEREALTFLEAGATYVSVPSLLAGEQLGKYVRALLEGELTSAELRSKGMAALERDRQLQETVFHA